MRNRLVSSFITILAFSGLLGAPLSAYAMPVSTVAASTDSSGNIVGNSFSDYYSNQVMSSDGNLITFVSNAKSLDPNHQTDGSSYYLYVKNLSTSNVQLVSLTSSGAVPNSGSITAFAITSDGSSVFFATNANNILSSGTTGFNLYKRNISTGLVQQVNIGQSGATISRVENFSISDNGQFASFNSPTNNSDGSSYAYVRDTVNNVTTTPALLTSAGKLSGDGNYVAYEDNNGNLYRYKLSDGSKTAVSVDSNNAVQAIDPNSGFAINYDGSVVAFGADVNLLASQTAHCPTISGGYYARNLNTSQTTLLDVDDSGNQPCCSGQSNCIGTYGFVSIDASGNKVAFYSAEPLDGYDGTLGDQLFVRNVSAGTTRGMTVDLQGDRYSDNTQNGYTSAYISRDGNTAAFNSYPCQVDETIGGCNFGASAAIARTSISTTAVAKPSDILSTVYVTPTNVAAHHFLTAPSAPQNLTAVKGSSAGRINLAWSAPANNGNSVVTGYTIYRRVHSTTNTPSSFTQIKTTNATTMSYTNTGLTAGTTYDYEVTAQNAVGTSSPSNIASAQAPGILGNPICLGLICF